MNPLLQTLDLSMDNVRSSNTYISINFVMNWVNSFFSVSIVNAGIFDKHLNICLEGAVNNYTTRKPFKQIWIKEVPNETSLVMSFLQ